MIGVVNCESWQKSEKFGKDALGSRSFKVIELGTNRTGIYDFLLVTNSSLTLALSRTLFKLRRHKGRKSPISDTILSNLTPLLEVISWQLCWCPSLIGAARQPLFSVILSRSIYLCLSAVFLRCKALGKRLTPGLAHLKIKYVQTAGVRNIFPRTLRGCHAYIWPRCNLSPVVKIYIADIGVRDLAVPAKRLPTCQMRCHCPMC